MKPSILQGIEGFLYAVDLRIYSQCSHPATWCGTRRYAHLATTPKAYGAIFVPKVEKRLFRPLQTQIKLKTSFSKLRRAFPQVAVWEYVFAKTGEYALNDAKYRHVTPSAAKAAYSQTLPKRVDFLWGVRDWEPRHEKSHPIGRLDLALQSFLSR